MHIVSRTGLFVTESFANLYLNRSGKVGIEFGGDSKCFVSFRERALACLISFKLRRKHTSRQKQSKCVCSKIEKKEQNFLAELLKITFRYKIVLFHITITIDKLNKFFCPEVFQNVFFVYFNDRCKCFLLH